MSLQTEHPGQSIDASADLVGVCILGRYEIQRFLGRGALGKVFACRDRELGNLTVALKIFPFDIKKDRVASMRLAREARAAYRVQHDNVVRFYDLIQADEFTAISMEYVEGTKLTNLIYAPRLMPSSSAVEILMQICSGLQAIHAHGIIHRDLKPDNILMADSRVAKISDFGISLLNTEDRWCKSEAAPCDLGRDHIEDLSVTLTGQIPGTSEYLSPECISEQTLDMRADIYALGVIAYELIAGQYIFEYDSVEHLMRRKVDEDPISPVLLRQDCPETLSSFCMKALARDPRDRFQSAEACLQALQQATRAAATAASLTRSSMGRTHTDAAEAEERSMTGLLKPNYSWCLRLMALLLFVCLLVVFVNHCSVLNNFVRFVLLPKIH